MTIGISKEELVDIDPWAYDNQQDLLNAILERCRELNPWLPIGTRPASTKEFLSLSHDRDSIEWLSDHDEDDVFYNHNSNNYTKKEFWTHYQEIAEFPKD